MSALPIIVSRIHQVLDCSPTNRELELGLDRRETGKFFPTDDSVAIVIQPSTRGTVDSHNWSSRLTEPLARNRLSRPFLFLALSILCGGAVLKMTPKGGAAAALQATGKPILFISSTSLSLSPNIKLFAGTVSEKHGRASVATGARRAVHGVAPFFFDLMC